jgi:nucleoside 2-deoxyribosyltransferase
MQIYFSGSIRGVKPKRKWFQTLIKHLKTHGNVLTEHIFDYDYNDEIKINDELIWKRDMQWLRNADAVVAEVSAPSLGVGYELGKAEELDKPILCLHRIGKKKLSAMIRGNLKVTVREFVDEDQAFVFIDEFFKDFQS